MESVDIATIEPTEIGPGITVRMLPGPDTIRTWVVDMAPGSEWPEVDVHTGYGEIYFVVEGEVIEGDQKQGPGTCVHLANGTRHRPRTETGARIFGFNYDC